MVQAFERSEIPPNAVQSLPSSMMVDLNNDGTPDAYWDNNPEPALHG